MRKSFILCSPLLATLALTSRADAVTYYVSPTGTAIADCTTRDAPCDLASAAGFAVAGDIVTLMDGTYTTALNAANSGTSSAWITFQADQCATPIIEGPGDPESQAGGVGSSTGTYLRFNGLISRGWNTGFGNGWTGEGTTTSNGHFEYQYCIGDANGRTGFTFFSAEGIHIQNCISAHNGSSPAHSWSSGITLYEAFGTSNLIEGTVSFENMDAQKNTDGNGFIVDESSDSATFINNLAFGNGGSCFRLTKSSGTKFINNTCYHNGQNPSATGPTNPSEIYFTDTSTTTTGVTIMNNIFVASGLGADAKPIVNKPTSGWSNNVDAVNSSGSSYFTSADGTNPDFTITSAASSTLVGKGAVVSGVPSNDIGFNPKCITKKTPTTFGTLTNASWWKYSVDVDYIKSIGGVAKCFIPKTRSGTPDIGAYANGAVSTNSTGTCTPPTTGGASNTGGAKSTGGTSGSNGGATGNVGGTTTTNSSSTGNASAGGSTSSSTGPTGSGGSSGSLSNVGGSSAVGGQGSTVDSNIAGSAGTAVAATSANANEPVGCGCRVSGQTSRTGSLAVLGLLGLAHLRVRRRRSSR